MATATLPVTERENYLNKEYGIRSWLFTIDHKRIALLYLLSVTFFFFIGGLFALLIRLELLTPAGDLVQADTYNKLFTMHGMVMVFFFLIPVVPATLGNFLVPIMIGAKDLAFPRINLMSWYLYVIGGILIMHCMLTGGVDTGWTFYTPYSTAFTNTKIIEAGLAVFVAGFSSIFTGLNFIVTVHRMRAPGMTWGRLPLFIWANYATSIIMILGTPVVAITIILVAAERLFHLGIFDPKLGGDPLLFQHLFWFYSHPAVYIMILPSMGIISEIITCFSRKRIFGYKFVALSSVAIAVLGFLVWAHHMFVAGMSVYAALIFSFLSYMVAVPSAIKVFNWTATMYKGSISYTTPMLYAFGFLGLFTIGGLTGLFLASLGIDVHVTDTYFVVAHGESLERGQVTLAVEHRSDARRRAVFELGFGRGNVENAALGAQAEAIAVAPAQRREGHALRQFLRLALGRRALRGGGRNGGGGHRGHAGNAGGLQERPAIVLHGRLPSWRAMSARRVAVKSSARGWAPGGRGHTKSRWRAG